MQFLTDISTQSGMDINGIPEQLNRLKTNTMRIATTTRRKRRWSQAADTHSFPACPVNQPEPAKSYFERHPAICTSGRIAGVTAVVVGVTILVVSSRGSAGVVIAAAVAL